MPILYHPKWPELQSVNPPVTFKNHYAEVSAKDAKKLLALGVGIVKVDAIPDNPGAIGAGQLKAGILIAPTIDSAEGQTGTGIAMPRANANVNECQAFCEGLGIEVPEGSTKAEMRALAEAHVAQASESLPEDAGGNNAGDE